MQQRVLGQSKLRVSAIGLGGMPLSIANRPSEKQSIEVICAAIDAGIRFIDTANVYCLNNNDIGHNERLIGKALKAWGGTERIVVATKGGLERPGGEWTRNASPKHLRAACEGSLRALNTESIDLYQLHAPDPKVPFADSVGALAKLKEEGKIRYIGLSNVNVEQLQIASQITKFVSVQNRCSPFHLAAFRDGVFRYCDRNDISFLPYSPVGGSRGKSRVSSNLHLIKIGHRMGASPFEVVLAWLLQISPIMVPIPGASKVQNARSSARAADITLSPEDIVHMNRLFLNSPTLKI